MKKILKNIYNIICIVKMAFQTTLFFDNNNQLRINKNRTEMVEGNKFIKAIAEDIENISECLYDRAIGFPSDIINQLDNILNDILEIIILQENIETSFYYCELEINALNNDDNVKIYFLNEIEKYKESILNDCKYVWHKDLYKGFDSMDLMRKIELINNINYNSLSSIKHYLDCIDDCSDNIIDIKKSVIEEIYEIHNEEEYLLPIEAYFDNIIACIDAM